MMGSSISYFRRGGKNVVLECSRAVRWDSWPEARAQGGGKSGGESHIQYIKQMEQIIVPCYTGKKNWVWHETAG